MNTKASQERINQIAAELHEILPCDVYREGEHAQIEWDSLSVIIAMANSAERWGVELDFESVQKSQTPLDLAQLIGDRITNASLDGKL